MKKKNDYHFHLISNQVRFGCGSRTVDGRRQYFAFHGEPNRNDDYFTNVEISETEYREIMQRFPRQIVAHRDIGDPFRQKYIDGHPVLLEGWSRLL